MENLIIPAQVYLNIFMCPQEMLISPALLDFLEQALEPIPMAMINLAASTKGSKSEFHQYINVIGLCEYTRVQSRNMSSCTIFYSLSYPAGMRNNPSNLTDLDASASSLVSTGTYAYAQFPVDVVVYISVQPSLIR